MNPIASDSLDQLFFNARTANGFLDQPVPAELLRQVYEAAAMAPTSMNTQPTRYVFVTTPEAKARLLPTLSPGNVEKTKSAPVTVIVAWDREFYEQLPALFPHADARSWFTGSPEAAKETAFRNSSLQAGYLILAARSLGLDAGPMSGFDPAKVNDAFFPDGQYQVNLLINLGYGDASKLHPRLPRLSFEQASRFA